MSSWAPLAVIQTLRSLVGFKLQKQMSRRRLVLLLRNKEQEMPIMSFSQSPLLVSPWGDHSHRFRSPHTPTSPLIWSLVEMTSLCRSPTGWASTSLYGLLLSVSKASRRSEDQSRACQTHSSPPVSLHSLQLHLPPPSAFLLLCLHVRQTPPFRADRYRPL